MRAAFTIKYYNNTKVLCRTAYLPSDRHTAFPTQIFRKLLMYWVLSLNLLYPPHLPLFASRNLLLYQSLPMSTPGRHAIVRRRKDDLCVGTAASGIVA
jgi:hypothetical protein